MAYTYTEKKRIRKDFGKLKSAMNIPYLLEIQINYYKEFTQVYRPVQQFTRELDYKPAKRIKKTFAGNQNGNNND